MNRSVSPLVSAADIAAFQRDGAICLRGVFKDWVGSIAAGIERNQREPGPYATNVVAAGEPGGFFDDYCNWERIPEFVAMVRESPAAAIAAAVMQSPSAQFFHDHVLVKEPGTQKPTPWHQDIPYYFLDGEQTVSLWIPVDPVREATLRLIAGSHLWPQWVLPLRWKDDSSFYEDVSRYRPVPDPDVEPGMQVLEWQMEPGTRCCSTSAPCTAHAAISARPAGACCRCAGWARTCVMPSALAGPRRRTLTTACKQASACARTGSHRSGRQPDLPERPTRA